MLFAAGAAFKTLSQLTTAEFVPRRLLLLMTDESAAQPFTASDAEAISLTLPALVAALQTSEKEAATTALIADGQDLVEEVPGRAPRWRGCSKRHHRCQGLVHSPRLPRDCPGSHPRLLTLGFQL